MPEKLNTVCAYAVLHHFLTKYAFLTSCSTETKMIHFWHSGHHSINQETKESTFDILDIRIKHKKYSVSLINFHKALF